MKTTIIAYPRIGAHRELKRAEEAYFKGTLTQSDLLKTASELRRTNLKTLTEHGLSLIPVGDFSFYDGMLDTACMLGIVPERYRKLGLSELDTYFAMAHGWQNEAGDVTALAMKKWFNTNYHYIVPEFDDGTAISLHADRLLEEIEEAKQAGIEDERIKVSVTGPLTFLRLTHFTGNETADTVSTAVASACADLISRLPEGCWVEFDEPWLVRDLTEDDIRLFRKLYTQILDAKSGRRILLQTYFGDIRDCYKEATALPFDGIGLDFVEGRETTRLVRTYGFPDDKVLFAGIVNGKNIWTCNYDKALAVLPKAAKLVLTTSCSLLHVPYTTANETRLPADVLKHFAFAEQKLGELQDLAEIADERAKGAELSDHAVAALDENLLRQALAQLVLGDRPPVQAEPAVGLHLHRDAVVQSGVPGAGAPDAARRHAAAGKGRAQEKQKGEAERASFHGAHPSTWPNRFQTLVFLDVEAPLWDDVSRTCGRSGRPDGRRPRGGLPHLSEHRTDHGRGNHPNRTGGAGGQARSPEHPQPPSQGGLHA